MSFSKRMLPAFLALAWLFTSMPSPVHADVSAPAAIAALEATQAGFQLVHSRIAPSVVTISSSNDNSRSTGSGVIIRPEGIVLTNRHVVENAKRVTVQLSDNTKELSAEVVQSDEKTDLAIVKITVPGTYPAAVLGDSSKVGVGDWAIAFGSPYGLRSTMTVGVISAIGRKLGGPVGDFNYYDLLQTDASINHGNSGGPLVNIRSEVVGINFMIFSPTENSGSVGIGFAIPINAYTKQVIDTLVSGKKVVRGLIGVQLSPLTDAMVEHFKVKSGALVQNVIPGGAGEKYGLKPEDVIVAFNDTEITSVDQLIILVQQTTPGSKATLKIIRNGKEQAIEIVLGGDTETTIANGDGGDIINEETLGITASTLTPQIARMLGSDLTSGVVITNVEQFSIADEAGITRGDIVLRVGDVDIKSVRDFWNKLESEMAKSTNGVVLRVQNGKEQRTISLPKMNGKK